MSTMKRMLPTTNKERALRTHEPRSGGACVVDGRDNAWKKRALGPHIHGNTARQVVDGLRTEVCGQQKQSNDPRNNQHNPNTPTTGAALAQTAHPATFSTAPATGLRERGNGTSRSTGRSGRQKAAAITFLLNHHRPCLWTRTYFFNFPQSCSLRSFTGTHPVLRGIAHRPSVVRSTFRCLVNRTLRHGMASLYPVTPYIARMGPQVHRVRCAELFCAPKAFMVHQGKQLPKMHKVGTNSVCTERHVYILYTIALLYFGCLIS